MLIGKLRQLGVYLDKHQFESGSAKLQVVRSAPLAEAEGRTFVEQM